MLLNLCSNRCCYNVFIGMVVTISVSILTDEYFHLKARMCINIRCGNCPLSCRGNAKYFGCRTLEQEDPDEALRIVKKWSEENADV